MKIKRHVCTLHVLVERERKGRREFLLFPHQKWQGTEPGTYALALPTKKVTTGASPSVPDEGASNRTLDDLLTEDLGLGLRNRHPGYRLQLAQIDLLSPTRKVVTRYSILPVNLPLPGYEQQT